MSIRSRSGARTDSSQVCFAVVPSGRLMVVAWTKVRVRNHRPSYRSCIRASSSWPDAGAAAGPDDGPGTWAAQALERAAAQSSAEAVSFMATGRRGAIGEESYGRRTVSLVQGGMGDVRRS